MNPLEELGREVTAVEDKLLERYWDAATNQQAFLDDAMVIAVSNTHETPRHWGMVAFAGALAASLALGVMFWPEAKEIESVETLESPKRIVVSESERVFNFSNGSNVVFTPQTLGEIDTVDDNRVTVLLKKGKANIDVVHKKNTRWRVSAGPFNVRVTGTKFDVEWDESSQLFKLALKEGTVELQGPMLGNGVILKAGREIVADLNRERMEMRKLGLESGQIQDTKIAEVIENDVKDVETPALVNAVKPVRKKQPKVSPCESFSKMAQEGDFNAAYSQFQPLVDTLLKSCRAQTLFFLGDTGRLNGDVKLAKKAYLALRRRFESNRLSSIAALQLGRLAFDHQKRYDRAIYWFETYLREGTDRTLSREALGRLMEAAERSTRHDKALSAARRYLESYPNGPHSMDAKRLLAE